MNKNEKSWKYQHFLFCAKKVRIVTTRDNSIHKESRRIQYNQKQIINEVNAVFGDLH